MDLKQLLTQTTVPVKGDTNIKLVDLAPAQGLGLGLGLAPELAPGPEPEPTADIESDNGLTTHEEGTSDVDIRFQLPWNKLEKGMKMNRILLFVKKETEEHDLSPLLSKGLKTLLFRGCEDGLFNKLSEVKYDGDTCTIDSFKSLEFNESTKKYKLRSGGTKNRSVSKSRSNLDRLMKKK